MNLYTVEFKFHIYLATEVEAENEEQAKLQVEDLYMKADYLKALADAAFVHGEPALGVEVLDVQYEGEIEDE